MKKNLFLSAIVTAGVLLNGATAAADERHPNMPNGMGKCNPTGSGCKNQIQSVSNNSTNGNNSATKKLTMDSVEKFQGTVQNVMRERYPDGRMFISISLETSEGDKTILIGPANYVDQSKVKLQIGDKITVKGFRVKANGEEMIIAKEVDKSGNVLQLLDDQRQPLWKNNSNNNYGRMGR